MASEKTQAQPGLVELAEKHFELSNELDRHMSARNYLFGVFNKEEMPSVLEFKTGAKDSVNFELHTRASISLNSLPQEVLETLLSYLISHEESMAFDCWERILKIAQTANTVVTNIKKKRDDLARKLAQEESSGDLTGKVEEMLDES